MSILGRLFHHDGMDDYRRGIVLYNKGEYDRAIEAFERTLEAISDPCDPYHNLGRFFAAEAHAKLGLALRQRGDLRRAAEEFRLAIGCGYRYPDLHVHLAAVLDQLADHRGAEQECRAALAIHPRYHDARCRLVLALAGQGRKEEAASELEILAETGFPVPGGRSAAQRPAIDSVLLGELRRAIESRQRSADHLRSALQSYDEGNRQEAIEELREAVREQPGYADLRCKLGSLLLESGQVEPALVELGAALAINPNYVEARLQAGLALLRSSDPGGAIVHLRVALERQPDYPDVHLFLGLAYLRDGQVEEAASILEQALEQIPNFHKARYLLALVRLVQGRLDEADRALRSVAEEDPLFPRARTTLGFLRLRSGQPTEAVSMFRGVLETDPDDCAASLGLGLSLKEMRELADARLHLTRLIRGEQPPLAALEALADLELEEKAPEEAIALLDRGLEVDAGHPRLLALRGRALAELGEHARSRENLETALVNDPEPAEVQVALALRLFRSGKKEAARAAMGAALRTDPTDPVAGAFADLTLLDAL